MLSWLKRLLGSPQPTGPPQTLRQFGGGDATISHEAIADGEGWTIEVADSRTVRLFEVAEPSVEQCRLTYRADLRSEKVGGRAYLEMWCRLPGGGEFFSKGFHNALRGSNEWASYEIPFFLKRGQRPDLVKLNLVVEGGGRVSIRRVALESTPLA